MAHWNKGRCALRSLERTPSSDPVPYGHTLRTGPLGGEVPLTCILGDQQAAMVGQVCLAPGEAKNTYGTGNFLLLNTGTEPVRSKNGLLTTVCYQFGDQPAVYALEGSIAVTGSAVQWLRDGLGIISSAAEVEALAGSVEDSGGVYLVPAFTGLGAPYWDSHARGALVGITRGTGRAQVARATLESIAFQVVDMLEAMAADSGERLSALRVDGGAAANGLLLQLQADLLGVPVERPVVAETTALGAAYLAGLAVGLFPDLKAVVRAHRVDRTYEPAMEAADRAVLFKHATKEIGMRFGILARSPEASIGIVIFATGEPGVTATYIRSRIDGPSRSMP